MNPWRSLLPLLVVVARRLVGFGSLSAPESVATSSRARPQSHRAGGRHAPCDSPWDGARTTSRKAIDLTLRSLVPRTRPMNYAEFLASQDLRVDTQGLS